MTPNPVAVQPRVFVNSGFLKFAQKSGLTDSDLCTAVRNLQAGLVDADLGGGSERHAKEQENQAAFEPF